MARFIATVDGMAVTINGKIVVDTEEAWARSEMLLALGASLIRVPAATLGMPVSMFDSPAAKPVRWWEIEDGVQS